MFFKTVLELVLTKHMWLGQHSFITCWHWVTSGILTFYFWEIKKSLLSCHVRINQAEDASLLYESFAKIVQRSPVQHAEAEAASSHYSLYSPLHGNRTSQFELGRWLLYGCPKQELRFPGFLAATILNHVCMLHEWAMGAISKLYP